MPNSRSKLKRSPKPGQGSDGKPHSSKSLAWILLSVATMLVVGVVIGLGRQTGRKKSRPPSQSSVPSYVSRMPGTITYCRDIAPIIYNQCAPCHHAGQAAPFTLLSYQDVKKRAEQIVDVTQSRYMPPWLPEPGYGRFANERRLSVEEKGLLKQWVLEGGAEGDPKTLPPAPTWPEGWMLGKPDLVVTMPESFSLEAAGPDVYRNFVIPVTINRDRYVRAIEFVPGNFRIVHHAFIKVDATGASRKLDARDSIPGFPGMNSPAEMPKGQFLSWQPGKIPSAPPENLAWLLRKNSDLVLQEHLNRTGKPEILKSSVGLYFTDVIPSKGAYKLDLTSMHLDFPAGASNVVVSDTFTLPVDVEILAVLPHAHYLAKQMQGFATLPDGSKEWLLFIKEWDFRWQGDYRYEQPVHLPKGSTLHLEFTYDNSTNNVRNPNTPPKQVFYGAQSSDEMCELWFQMLPTNPADVALLDRSYQEHMREVFFDYYAFRLSLNPNDPEAHTKIGMSLASRKQFTDAAAHYSEAIRLSPEFEQAHYELGVLYRRLNRLTKAREELETALRLDPGDAKAYGHLGFTMAGLGNAEAAERYLRKSQELDPNDPLVSEGLEELRQMRARGPTR